MTRTPSNALQIVRELHKCYVERTGFEVAYNIARENTWRDWCHWSGWTWTTEDLARVIYYLRCKINKGERNDGALKFSNLIGSPDKFEEDLQLARKERQRLPQRRRQAPQAAPQESPEEAPLDPREAASLWREAFGK